MTQSIDVNGRSRRFRIMVVLAAILIVFAVAGVVSAIVSKSGDTGVQLDPNSESGLLGNPSDLASIGQNDTKEQTNDSESDGGEAAGESGDGVPVTGMDGTSDSLDSSETEGQLREKNTNPPGIDQLNLDSHRTFIEQTHFTVGTYDPQFWRMTTYDTYTPNGFLQNEHATPNTTSVLPKPENATGPLGESAVFTLKTNASRLPTSGTPTSIEIVSGADSDSYEFRVADDGTVIVTDGNGGPATLPAGTAYNLTFTNPEQGAASNATSEEIRSRYLQLPSSQPDRIGNLSDRIIASSDAETRVEKARAISSWLLENKSYKLNTTHDPSTNVVDEFLFEKEGGHTPYFTTATAVLLREQGIPARTVTGYTQGDREEDGLVEVGTMEQHTWVEVYNEQGEWVPVDAGPTEKAQEVQEAVRNGNPDALNYGASQQIINTWANESAVLDSDMRHTDGDVLEPPYEMDVNPSPTPGAEVTVTVTKNGTPVPHAPVKFNGELVGQTTVNGTLVATVPYTDSLTVTASRPSTFGQSQENVQETSASGERGGALASGVPPDDNRTNSSKTFTVPTAVSIESDTVILPGNEITAIFRVNGTRVPGVNVYIEGEIAGRTNEDGELTGAIPDDAKFGENVTVHVERDDLSSTTTVRVAEPSVRVDTGLLAIPGETANVTVIVSENGTDIILPNATLTAFAGGGVDNTPFAEGVEVREDGSASIELPWRNAVTITGVLKGGKTTTTVTGLYYPLGGLIGGGVLLFITTTWHIRRNGVPRSEVNLTSPDSLKSAFYRVIFHIAEYVRNGIRRVAASYERNMQSVREFASTFWIEIRDRNVTALVSMVAFLPRVVVKRCVKVVRSLISFFERLFESRENTTMSENPSGVTGSNNSSSSKHSHEDYERIRGFWRWLTRFVIAGRGNNTKTTVEIGQKAVEHGFPAEPVKRLRVAFQDIQYGSHDPDSRVESAEGAVDELRDTKSADSEGSQ